MLLLFITFCDHNEIKFGGSFPPPSPSPKLSQVGQLPSCKLQASLNTKQQNMKHDKENIYSTNELKN